ncbi:TolC family protein [Pseudoalteromonas sp. SMS1]|uniref:TolC family protein n=1 Tax=Pseudoalteromonas sp. SMS1 TaxID=2908894 RepID=UPI001F182137|nr:TolC family protein [Pseudoalteromonas sp. SMS1]MCF2858243.1 TolC family protein [Pseudoalteromonas sp. SMS1]
MWQNMVLVVAVTGVLVGCSVTSHIDESYQRQLSMPSTWQQTHTLGDVQPNWLAQLENQQVHDLIALALSNNFSISRKALEIETARQQLIISGSALWPTLDVSLDSARRKSANSSELSNSHSLNLQLNYELDLWGKLSAEERQANLSVMARQAEFLQEQYNLVAQVVISWFAVIEGQQQLALLRQRLALVEQNLDIIETGYKQGLNSALDVYLTRNEFSNESAKVAQQQALVSQRKRTLERLVGEYPSAQLGVQSELPLLNSSINVGIPSELVSRKPALLSSWYKLLQQDAALAFAHKSRFPSINLAASYGPSGTQFKDAFSMSAAGWSLLSGVSAPLFNAGKLAANEELARIQLKGQELSYLDSLQDAFAAVENGISSEQALRKRYQETLISEQNAKLAERLSFEQYQKGLVSYTTVLDAQKRSFEAQSSLISIKNELIKNRVELHLALGGDFKLSRPKENNHETT